jgi:hypothetical protein
LSGNTLVAQFDINPAEFHLANPGNCLNNRGHLFRESAFEFRLHRKNFAHSEVL